VARLAEKGINVELHRLSGVPNSLVPIWLNATDVLLLTSLHEGSPTIVKEALACGTPIVSVNVGDVAERIEGVSGCHIVEAQPEAIALSLKAVLQARQRLTVGSELRNICHLEVAHRLKDFYHEVVSLERRARDELASETPLAPWNAVN
jgi:glycosyltransferase involved in cell wall biosynthesis